MNGSPSSLTATVHVRFHYDKDKVRGSIQGDIKMLGRLLEQASDMDPHLQELLIKFAQHLKEDPPGGEEGAGGKVGDKGDNEK